MEKSNSSITFSIIMTAYNSEQYISCAINSILDQQFKNWELIIVDDCSNDSTLSVCNDYAERDNRIRVVHLESNCGPYLARIKGIQEANGKYLLFLDSDDEYRYDSLNIIYKHMNQYDLDCLFYNCICVDGSEYSTLDITTYPNTIIEDLNGIVHYYFSNYILNQGLYRKCFRNPNKTICADQTKKYKMFEDGLQTLYLLKDCKKVLFVNDAFYNYNCSNNSSLTKQKKLFFNNMDALDETITVLLSLQLSNSELNYCLNKIMSAICMLLKKNYLLNNKRDREINIASIKQMTNYEYLTKTTLNKDLLNKDYYLFSFFKSNKKVFLNTFLWLYKLKKRRKK